MIRVVEAALTEKDMDRSTAVVVIILAESRFEFSIAVKYESF